MLKSTGVMSLISAARGLPRWDGGGLASPAGATSRLTSHMSQRWDSITRQPPGKCRGTEPYWSGSDKEERVCYLPRSNTHTHTFLSIFPSAAVSSSVGGGSVCKLCFIFGTAVDSGLVVTLTGVLTAVYWNHHVLLGRKWPRKCLSFWLGG